MSGFDEGFDNHGLRITVTADYEYEEKGIRTQYVSVASDPGIESLVEMMVGLVESCYGWETTREDIKIRLAKALMALE